MTVKDIWAKKCYKQSASEKVSHTRKNPNTAITTYDHQKVGKRKMGNTMVAIPSLDSYLKVSKHSDHIKGGGLAPICVRLLLS